MNVRNRSHAALLATGLLGAWAATLGVNRSLLRIRGGSMEPTLSDGDVVLVTSLPERLGLSPRPGWVVEVDLPGGRGRGVKRVKAINNDGSVWLVGDAANASTDSRDFGALPASMVRRRVLAKVRPAGRIGAG